MKRSRARLVASPGARVNEAFAETPQRWTVASRRTDGWADVVHQVLGEGVFGGDAHQTVIHADQGTLLVVRAVAATPLRGPGASLVATRITVDRGATLLYLPGALVPQLAADHTSSLRVDVAPGGRALVAQAITPGRSGMGERGTFHRLRFRTKVMVANALAFAEDAVIDPGVTPIDSPGMFAGAGAVVSVLGVGTWDVADVGWWREVAGDGVIGGASALRSGGVAFRALSRTLGDAQAVMAAIEQRACEALGDRLERRPAVNFCSSVGIIGETTRH